MTKQEGSGTHTVLNIVLPKVIVIMEQALQYIGPHSISSLTLTLVARASDG